jgi:nitrogenase delta subunit
MAEENDARVEELVNYIMKNCLWQFHSRAWDRTRQNENIIGQTTRLLCGGNFVPETDLEKCYWADAYCLAEAFRERFPWLSGLGSEALKKTMQALLARMEQLTVSGSLNRELNDQHY